MVNRCPYLALVAHAVTQTIGGMELEDGLRTVRRPKRLQAHCGVCISPRVMLNPPGGWHGSGGSVGAIILMLRPNSNCHTPGISGV